jgi:hypothetical protein
MTLLAQALRARLARSEAPLAGRLRTARELAGDRPAESAEWSRGLPELGALLPGGLPRGGLVELAGRRSSGRMSWVHALLAAATAHGESAALVDLGDGLDPQQAAESGVVLERLLWARPRELRETLAAAETIVAGGLPLVVVELGLAPVPGGRGSDAQWLRLGRAAQAAGATLVVSSPTRRCGVAATLALELERPRARWAGTSRLLERIDSALVLERARGAIAPAAPAETVRRRAARAS